MVAFPQAGGGSVTAIPGLVLEACAPYPMASSLEAFRRHSRWLEIVLDRLDRGELEEVARTLALLCPREFEQELLSIQRRRDWRKAAVAE